MITSLLYVSQSTLRLPSQAGEVDAIVAQSQGRNAAEGITGALVFTERLFAQNLEGSDHAVDALLERLRRDPRHRDIEIVYRQPIPARRFNTWALAYAGPSTFVAGNVLPLTDGGPPAATRKAAERLIKLMSQFVDAHLIGQRRNSSQA